VSAAAVSPITRPDPTKRFLALDTARGLAVGGMIVLHLVPMGETPSRLGAVEGISAALFFILIGMSWGIQADHAASDRALRWYVARRTLALFAFGLLLHKLVWPTEVLTPFALMMGPSIAVRRAGRNAVVTAIAANLVAAPIVAGLCGQYLESDWLESGSHLADSSIGWVTLRYLLIDGNYPLVPWLAFPLFGMLIFQVIAASRVSIRWWLAIGILAGASMLLFTSWTEAHATALGEAANYLSATWVPTTLPFMIIKGGIATAIIAFIALWQEDGRFSRKCNPLSFLGRTSLTHYLGHICFVFAPLRLMYPGEDWPVGVGVAAALIYLSTGCKLSKWWLGSHKRGPLEQGLARLSGDLRKS
jgi:uncharacterized protein